jgi:hypothetical protein
MLPNRSAERSRENEEYATPAYDAPHRTESRYHGHAMGGEYAREPREDRRWLYIALGIGALVVASSFALSFMFAGATVTAFPKQDTIVVNTSFLARTEGTEGALPFEQVVLERTKEKAVPALAEQQVDERATGNITIYNEYSETPQRLIKNTRFQSEDGKIFRIRESVEVPGKTGDTKPGTIEVAVFAEEPGDAYNLEPGSFTIPGFVGLPQEGKVYAKSSTAFANGFSGVRRTIAESDRRATLEELERELRDLLLATAFEPGNKPDGYYLFKEAVFFEFNPLPDTIVEEDKVTLSLSGKIHGMLFKEDAFAKRLAELTIASYKGSSIRLDNPYDLSVKVAPATGDTETPAEGEEEADEEESTGVEPAWQATAYTVSVQGKAQFIWEFDASRLASDLVGKEKSILDVPANDGILQAYPGIDRIHATVRPFWKKTFPDSTEDIVVLTELDA